MKPINPKKKYIYIYMMKIILKSIKYLKKVNLIFLKKILKK